jgi:cell filamentation protein
VKKPQKYDTSGSVEEQHEPGSRGRVLKNLLGVKSKRIMDAVEAREYDRLMRGIPAKYKINQRLTAKDVCDVHKSWLDSIYPWAGQYRSIDLAKPEIRFAHAQYIPRLMADLEKGALSEFTPCCFMTENELPRALAVVHVELVLIHPFREGNGRISRLISVLMAGQAGLPPLDFWGVKGKALERYFVAVRAGQRMDFEPMENIFREVIERTVKT